MRKEGIQTRKRKPKSGGSGGQPHPSIGDKVGSGGYEGGKYAKLDAIGRSESMEEMKMSAVGKMDSRPWHLRSTYSSSFQRPAPSLPTRTAYSVKPVALHWIPFRHSWLPATLRIRQRLINITYTAASWLHFHPSSLLTLGSTRRTINIINRTAMDSESSYP